MINQGSHMNRTSMTHRGICVLFCMAVAVSVFLLVRGQFQDSFVIKYSIKRLRISGEAFQYSLWGGVHQLWEDKMYVLFTVLLFWSGVWPYVKLALLCGILLLHTIDHSTTAHWRLSCVRWLSRLGKWSFVDVWMVAMMCVIVHRQAELKILRFHVRSDLHTEVLEGLVTFMAGLICSQLTSTAAVHWVKATIKPSLELPLNLNRAYASVPGIDLSDRESSEGCISTNHIWCGAEEVQNVAFLYFPTLRCTYQSLYRCVLSCILLFIWVFYIGSMFTVPVFEAHYTARGVSLGGAKYTVFEAIQYMWQTQRHAALNRALCRAAAFFVTMCPVAQQVLLAVMWFVPMSTRNMMHLDVLFDFISHFSCLDVFLVSAVVVIHELEPMLTNSGIDDYIHIKAHLLPGIYTMLVLVVLAMWVRCEVCSAFRIVLATKSADNRDDSSERMRTSSHMIEFGNHSVNSNSI